MVDETQEEHFGEKGWRSGPGTLPGSGRVGRWQWFLNVGERTGRLRAGEKVQDLAMAIWGAITGVSRKMKSQGRL